MKNSLPPLLLVDDEANMKSTLEPIFHSEGYQLDFVQSAEDAIQKIQSHEYFLVITDFRLSGKDGFQLVDFVKNNKQDLPIVMITAYASARHAVEAIQAGAMDYLSKPFEPEELLHVVSRAAERYNLLATNRAYREKIYEKFGLDNLVGDCENIRQLKDMIRTVAPTDATVLIVGESGTGKELVAGALHQLSHRSPNRYIRINCAAIPHDLLESELFGHEKGSFTGALRQKIGRVEEADNGTLFLDEIGEMSRSLQAKLLRFLEDGTFFRIGGNDELKVNVRVLAATNRNILEAIRSNEFREDLYHRLNVVQLQPAPLRDRGKDVFLLANHFLDHFCNSMNRSRLFFSKPAKALILNHSWPGNVRELRNAIERAVIMERTQEIQVSSLPEFHKSPGISGSKVYPELELPVDLEKELDDFEKYLILKALRNSERSISKASSVLGISRHALRYRMKRLDLLHHADDTAND
ncbi:MAG: sigma-54 dependent transcriptional regulator [Verrucomicrobia bacterium]|nr:sigma-54 dependent transcriptional regulator [Verrucomicrobiota bacterium]